MYRPPAFREDRRDVLHAAIRAHPLATLVTHGASGLVANLVPFILATDADGKDVLRAHLAKANGQIDELRTGTEAMAIFQGPQAYVTPSWYPAKQRHGKVVPTWNYVMVQVSGAARVIDDPQWLMTQIELLTMQQEAGRAEPWAVSDAPAEFVAGQLKGISGIEIAVTRIEGKWKASQNQAEKNRAGVVAGLRAVDPDSPMAAIVDGELT